MDHRRGIAAGRLAPGPFHCIACRTYVTGTPAGHCPKCGFVPPAALELPTPRPRKKRGSWLDPWLLTLLVGSLALIALFVR